MHSKLKIAFFAAIGLPLMNVSTLLVFQLAFPSTLASANDLFVIYPLLDRMLALFLIVIIDLQFLVLAGLLVF